jgi:hypothetical protein
VTGGRGEFLRYLLLRATTAGATLVTGVCQIYVFARVLDPHLFSLFIIVGNLGLSLWLFDLGIAKVLYVNLRARFLGGGLVESGDAVPLGLQAASVTVLYVVLALLGAVGCFAFSTTGGEGASQGLAFALFFVYSALNLAWFALRNVSAAVDRFLYFETLEAVRRVGHLTLLFALLFGLPFMDFLVASNLLWLVLLTVMVRRLRAGGAIVLAGPSRLWAALRRFVGANGRALLGSGGYAAGEIVIYNYPSILVPLAMGLGAPVIVFDTAFKIFRGANVVFSAACDLVVPRQTRAFGALDRRGLLRATLAGAALGAVPAIALCGLLAGWGDRLYALLLGNAAQMPPSVTPILMALVACNLVQTVANYLLAHTGYFPAMVRAAGAMTAVMAVVAAVTAAFGLDVVGFLAIYSCAYAASAVLYAILAWYGPLSLRPLGGGGATSGAGA